MDFITEAMYAPLLHQEFYVNPFEVPKRLISLKDEINLMMYEVKKKKKKKRYKRIWMWLIA